MINLGIRAREAILDACSTDPQLHRMVKGIFDDPEYADLIGRDKRLVEIVDGLRPQEPLTDDPLHFDPEVMRRWVELGDARAREVVTESPFAPRCRRGPRARTLAPPAALPL
jgi:hypothetical protein